MYGLQPEENDRYPHPLNRMNAIIEYFYGAKIADIVEETYRSESAWIKLLPDNCPEIESKEIYFFKAIENKLTKIFEGENWVEI
jgi:hypothetical protein